MEGSDSRVLERVKMCDAFYAVVERLRADYVTPSSNRNWSPNECVTHLFDWSDIRYKKSVEVGLSQKIDDLRRILNGLMPWIVKVRNYLVSFDDTICSTSRTVEIMNIFYPNESHIRTFIIPFINDRFDTIFDGYPDGTRAAMRSSLSFIVALLDCPPYKPRL